MTTNESRDDMNDEVAGLVRLAGSSPISAERLARVRAAVYGAWSDEYVAQKVKTSRRLTVAVLLAAAASVVIGVAIWSAIRTRASVSIARIDRVTEQATSSRGPVADGDTVTSGSTITTSAGTLAMTLPSGVHLRLDVSSAIRLDSATDVVLERGAVYVNSGGGPGVSPISIHTPSGGVVRDIGTQFIAGLDGASLRILVRDGEVLVTYANGAQARVGADQELFSRTDGSDRSISPRPSAATGNEWAWAERAAPPFSMDRQTLGAFLDWVSREGALTVTFADSGDSAAKRAIKLSGTADSLKGLTLSEALDVVLPSCDVRYSIDIKRRQVVIEKDPSKGAMR